MAIILQSCFGLSLGRIRPGDALPSLFKASHCRRATEPADRLLHLIYLFVEVSETIQLARRPASVVCTTIIRAFCLD